MRKRYLVLGLAIVLALALSIPALGGSSSPTATTAATVKKTAKKALKKAKKADKTANEALEAAEEARPLWAAVTAGGTLARSNGASSSSHLATGLYEVNFDRNLSQCSWVAAVGSTTGVPVASGEVSTSLRSPAVNDALLFIVNNSAGAVADKPFHVTVNC